MNMFNRKIGLGIVVSTRDFFSDALVREAREQVVQKVKRAGARAFILPVLATPKGAVESYNDSLKCAAYFKEHAVEIDGIVISLPNFGSEIAVVETIHAAKLEVPILLHAFPDEFGKTGLKHRRDAFCGKFSVANNLYQYGITYINMVSLIVLPQTMS